MPSFDILKKIEGSNSFRVNQVKGIFDLKSNKVQERFSGMINLENPWNIGVIYGNSGSGKSTIAKYLFEDCFFSFDYRAQSILDDFPEKLSIKKLMSLFNSVGFSSAPSWLKPYRVLSTGERMRVDLAMCIAQEKEIIIFDEFTSVIDREVAKFCSYAINRAIHRMNKKFIAISCHEDILEWLEPDWIFNTNTMTFKKVRLRRPKIELKIYEKRNQWEIFRKYHYLNTEINRNSDQYVAYINDKPVAFFAVIHFPHSKNKKIKKGHRLVVLPTYQGCGIGMKFKEYIADLYFKKGFDFFSATSQSYYAKAHLKNKKWKLQAKGFRSLSKSKDLKHFNRSISKDRILYSFKYLGNG